MAQASAVPGLPALPRASRRARRARTRKFSWLAIAAVAVTLGYGALISHALAGQLTPVVARLTLVIAPLAVAIACWARSRAANGRERLGWSLLSGSMLGWAAGTGVAAYYDLVADRALPFPSAADAGYLAAMPFAIGAVLAFPTVAREGTSRARSVVDLLIIATALLCAGWVASLGVLLEDRSGSALEYSARLAHPVGNILVATAVLLVATRARRGSAALFTFVGAGLVTLAGVDTLLSTIRHGNDFGETAAVMCLAGFLAIAVAAARNDTFASASASELSTAEALHPLAALLAYPPVLFAAAAAAWEQTRTGHLSPLLAWDLVVIGVLLVVRQMMTLVENLTLMRSLEAKVTARTIEVEEKAALVRGSEERNRLVLETANDAFISMDADGKIVAWNRRAEQTFGWTWKEAIGQNLAKKIIPERSRINHSRGLMRFLETGESSFMNRRVEVTALHRDGHEFPVELTVWAVRVGKSRTFNAFIRDISERKAFEDQLSHQALHDPLTSLPNRSLFHDRLSQALARAERFPQPVAVLFLDLNEFKTVNDSLGHASGDELLLAVSQRLRAAMRPDDTVARLGGDEFAVLLDSGNEHVEATTVARRVIETLAAPFTLQGKEVFVTASIGIASSSGDLRADELIRNADVAMYQAKSTHGGYQVYEDGMHAAMVDRLELEADLRRALDNEEFVLYYQPVVALATGKVAGVEALVRWQHPSRGLVTPGSFIPAAEQTGLIVPMGRWILEQACLEAREWRNERAGPPLSLTVNLSARQLQDPSLVVDVSGVLRSTGIDPQQVVLEITESVLMDDAEHTIKRLKELKNLGVRLAIDDFGTGYSSLSYLHRFPVDVLKIDQFFVSNIPSGSEDMALVRTIVKLGQTFGLSTVAEGVERPEQLAELRAMGCLYGQGFYFAEPVPDDGLREILRRGGSLVPDPPAPVRVASEVY